MNRVLLFTILLLFSSCNENIKNSEVLLSSERNKMDRIKDERSNENLFKIVKIDSIDKFYIIYAKKKAVYFKIISEKKEQTSKCKKINRGNYLSLDLESIIPDTSKISYKVGGVLYKGVEFYFESDSILDIYKTTNFKGLCYSPENRTQDTSKNNTENEAYDNKIFQEALSNLNFDTTNCIQKFDVFFDKFSRDSIFQKKWIVFPLKDSYLGGDFYEDLLIEYIDSSIYKFKDFSKDKYAMDKEFDKYRTYFDFKEAEVRYQWRGYDNGIFIDYIFKKINNCWFLIAIEDTGT